MTVHHCQPSTQSHIVLMQLPPDAIEQGYQALQTVQEILQYHPITMIFFYSEATLYATPQKKSSSASLQAAWLQLSQDYAIPLAICSTLADRYQLSIKELIPGFQASGLTEFMSMLADTDVLLQFQPQAQTKASQ